MTKSSITVTLSLTNIPFNYGFKCLMNDTEMNHEFHLYFKLKIIHCKVYKLYITHICDIFADRSDLFIYVEQIIGQHSGINAK